MNYFACVQQDFAWGLRLPSPVVITSLFYEYRKDNWMIIQLSTLSHVAHRSWRNSVTETLSYIWKYVTLYFSNNISSFSVIPTLVSRSQCKGGYFFLLLTGSLIKREKNKKTEVENRLALFTMSVHHFVSLLRTFLSLMNFKFKFWTTTRSIDDEPIVLVGNKIVLSGNEEPIFGSIDWTTSY